MGQRFRRHDTLFPTTNLHDMRPSQIPPSIDLHHETQSWPLLSCLQVPLKRTSRLFLLVPLLRIPPTPFFLALPLVRSRSPLAFGFDFDIHGRRFQTPQHLGVRFGTAVRDARTGRLGPKRDMRRRFASYLGIGEDVGVLAYDAKWYEEQDGGGMFWPGLFSGFWKS